MKNSVSKLFANSAIFYFLSFGIANAEIVGKFIPAVPLSDALVSSSHPINEKEWHEYIAQSDAQREQDKAIFDKQILSGQNKLLPIANLSSSTATENTKLLSILSFQMPSGGWYKALPRNIIRQNGYAYSPEGSYEATIDNDATYEELKFLSHAYSNAPDEYKPQIINALENGAKFLIKSQYPNGGYPQMYPLRGWYHDAVTLNDDAMLNTIKILGDIADGKDGFAQISTKTREQAKTAQQKALSLLVSLQVKVNGKKTIWAQQYDPLTLLPCSARNFEMTSLASGESANILLYLMKIQNPSKDIKDAIISGIEYFDANKIENKKWEKSNQTGNKELIDAIGAKPLLARYYDITSNQPLFGDRDKTIHDNVYDLSLERRNGYSWYNTSYSNVMKAYDEWKKANNK
ncbi:pectate lyase [Pseudaquidulcibacter saccharophilus]|uniref:pectate lyase n=1 Tax=Pseudaquidulcibacter saccharophilus TaxID=2831900 RepID=UPI001EFF18D1|nr:pectate lyase [Pseudaquidulcibacter saccharophilus]